MRHRKSGRKLGRSSSHREAMYRNMVTSLFLHGRIRTTDAKAKELRRIADRVVTMGKRSPTSSLEGLSGEELLKAKARRLHQVRRARHWVKDRSALSRVFGEYADRFKERAGGYTRIIKLGVRPGDNAEMVLIELVGDGSETAPAGADVETAPAAQAPADEPSPAV